MNVYYNDTTDLLYIRLNNEKQDVVNKRVDEDVALDVGNNNQIVGIEIMNASAHLNLKQVLPIKYLKKENVA